MPYLRRVNAIVNGIRIRQPKDICRGNDIRRGLVFTRRVGSGRAGVPKLRPRHGRFKRAARVIDDGGFFKVWAWRSFRCRNVRIARAHTHAGRPSAVLSVGTHNRFGTAAFRFFGGFIILKKNKNKSNENERSAFFPERATCGEKNSRPAMTASASVHRNSTSPRVQAYIISTRRCRGGARKALGELGNRSETRLLLVLLTTPGNEISVLQRTDGQWTLVEQTNV